MRPTNLLVAGDNLEVLPHVPGLVGPIDLVVSDPPYNTGHDFAYADDRRGAWVSMMRPRLRAIREVVAGTGAVCLSIDDREVAHLRLLMDEVLGESNFLAQVVVELNPKGRQLGGGFATSHEYLLVYARDRRRCVLEASTSETVDPDDFPHITPDGRHYRRLPLRNTNKRFNPTTARTLSYPLWGDPETGQVGIAPFDGAVEIVPVFGDGTPAVWRWSAPRVESRPDDLLCRRLDGRLGQRIDIFQRDWLHEGRRKKLRTVWRAEEVGSTDTAVAELKALIGPVFESPKPTGLVRRLLGTMPDDAVVLDPFAGSGTTGHAVAAANAEDGRSRRCLSIEQAVAPRGRSLAAAAGYSSIAAVTRARLEAVDDRFGGGFAEVDVPR